MLSLIVKSVYIFLVISVENMRGIMHVTPMTAVTRLRKSGTFKYIANNYLIIPINLPTTPSQMPYHKAR